MMISKIKNMLKSKSGVVSLEYGLGLALVALVFIIGMTDMNEKVVQMFYCNTPDQANENQDVCKDTVATPTP